MTRYAFKITLIGDGAVGKTSLRRRFMGQTFVANHLSTIGADFSAEKITLDNGDIVEFQIWDLAGQPGFKGIRSRFYSGARGGICVFDLTNPETLENITMWIEELYKDSGFGQVPIIMVGNKVDLRDQRTISLEEVITYKTTQEAKLGIDIPYIETSAKTGENVEKVFKTFAKILTEETNKQS